VGLRGSKPGFCTEVRELSVALSSHGRAKLRHERAAPSPPFFLNRGWGRQSVQGGGALLLVDAHLGSRGRPTPLLNKQLLLLDAHLGSRGRPTPLLNKQLLLLDAHLRSRGRATPLLSKQLLLLGPQSCLSLLGPALMEEPAVLHRDALVDAEAAELYGHGLGPRVADGAGRGVEHSKAGAHDDAQWDQPGQVHLGQRGATAMDHGVM